MSRSEKCVNARHRFDLLRSVHPVFCLSLPTIEDVENERYRDLPKAELANDITILRSDIKSLPFKLEQVDIDQVLSDADLDRLIEAFDSVLHLFEDSVLERTTVEGTQLPQNADCVALPRLFPKLVSLRSLLQQPDNKPDNNNKTCTNGTKTLAADDDRSPKPDKGVLFEKQASLLGSNHVSFPPPQKTMEMCRDIVERFGKVVADVFPDDARGWTAENQLEDITDAEIEYIREAHAFSQISSSLFSLLVDCITCQANHVARLHLFGFHKRQMEMLLGTHEQDWISACFTHSTGAASSEGGFSHRMCAHTTTPEYDHRIIQGSFDGTAIWEDCIQEHAACDLSNEAILPNTLNDLLQTPDTHTKRRLPRKLDRRGRKIIGVLLAYSLFQLCGSPWLQREFEGENILVLPSKAPAGQLHYWRPHISCDLCSYTGSRSLPEDVAALGVLVLELETNLKAEWTEDDEDYETEIKSNRARLSRILEEWKGELPDRYYGVGRACFLFEKHVEDFDHPELDQSLRDLAILYKCILNPLFRQLVSDFGDAERLFQGISSLSVPVRQKRASAAGQLVLYDDQESTEPGEKSRYADKLMETLDEGFLCDIRALRQTYCQMGLAETARGERMPENIRIAVLDTGIDMEDKMIKAAMKKKKIVDARTWVGESYCDSYGHGTHVARILIQMAPSAQIFIAKITDYKNIDPKDMGRIAEAIDWAVQKWDVDIISMSFGFENENDAIDEAIERAFKADKLMFVAASNEGGNKQRSRLGRSDSVICMHACDGKGNKGDMSPSPLKWQTNFTTLGVAVKSQWKKRIVYKSGTSFATPVAAGVAANVLEFANFKCNLSKKHKRLLYSRAGMVKLFQAMSEDRDLYDYVQPGKLWDGKEEDDVAREIQKILAS